MPTATLLTTTYHIQMTQIRDLCSFHMVGRYLQEINTILQVVEREEVLGRQEAHLVMTGLPVLLHLAVTPLYSP